MVNSQKIISEMISDKNNNVNNNKNKLVILSHNIGGGISQFVKSIIQLHINRGILKSFNVYTVGNIIIFALLNIR